MKRIMFNFKLFVLSMVIIFFSLSCHLFADWEEDDEITMYFSETNLTIPVGGLGALSLRVENTEDLGIYTVTYEVANEDVAMIFRADRNGVTFSGRGKGSTVITAHIGGSEAKAVISVVENF